MGVYIDGFVIPVKKKRVAEYRRMARLGAKVYKEYGALDYRECMADDAPVGKRTSFPRSVKLKADEVVWFSYIVYKSRKDRDRINAKVMQDPRFTPYMVLNKLPFDAKRMIMGGFRSVVGT